ncbi:MAG: hypothetical protein WC420_03955 [Candidatus Paceibacterota bacterium]
MEKIVDDFICKTCERILSQDSKSNELNKQVLDSERSFKKTLNKQQLLEYNKLEEVIIALMAHNEYCVYRFCMDKKAGVL